jgi:hypothetical protein
MKKLLNALMVTLLFIFLAGCYAEPTESDLERVKQQFLVMRFHAPFNNEWNSLSDKELFEKSCKANRVKCGPALDILKKQDPNFYIKLIKEK